jgi:hypothetical protein
MLADHDTGTAFRVFLIIGLGADVCSQKQGTHQKVFTDFHNGKNLIIAQKYIKNGSIPNLMREKVGVEINKGPCSLARSFTTTQKLN